MTLLTFAKAMLGDQLAKYGFEHRRNTTWVKVSDEGIYFTVGFKKRRFWKITWWVFISICSRFFQSSIILSTRYSIVIDL